MNKLITNSSRSRNSKNFKLIAIKFKNFCYKYVPNLTLKFEDISFHEPTCKIYEYKENKGKLNSIKSSNIFKLLSLTMYSTLLFNPFSYLGPSYTGLSLISNLISQPFFIFQIKNIERISSIYVKKFYVLRNGHQVLIITLDDSVYLVNIKDFVKYEESDDFDKIKIKTQDKEFVIDLKNSKYFNEDIFSAIKMRRIVNTQSSYDNYNRLTVQKLEDEFRARLNKPKRLKFNLDQIIVKKYLYSYNSFLLIRHLLNGNNFSKFYFIKPNQNKGEKRLEPEKMKQFKRKLNIHMYSDERFVKKFGIDILHFMGMIGSMDENSPEYKKLMMKLKESHTLGRNTREVKKKILI